MDVRTGCCWRRCPGSGLWQRSKWVPAYDYLHSTLSYLCLSRCPGLLVSYDLVVAVGKHYIIATLPFIADNFCIYLWKLMLKLTTPRWSSCVLFYALIFSLVPLIPSTKPTPYTLRDMCLNWCFSKKLYEVFVSLLFEEVRRLVPFVSASVL